GDTFEPVLEGASTFHRETSPDLAGVFCLAVSAIAEIESAQGAFARARVAVADDDEFLPLRTLGLQPGSLSSGQIRRLCLFGHDSFKTHAAGFGEHFSAMAFNVFAIAKDGHILRLVQ